MIKTQAAPRTTVAVESCCIGFANAHVQSVATAGLRPPPAREHDGTPENPPRRRAVVRRDELMGSEGRGTDALTELRSGRREVLDTLIVTLYDELREIAHRRWGMSFSCLRPPRPIGY